MSPIRFPLAFLDTHPPKNLKKKINGPVFTTMTLILKVLLNRKQAFTLCLQVVGCHPGALLISVNNKASWLFNFLWHPAPPVLQQQGDFSDPLWKGTSYVSCLCWMISQKWNLAVLWPHLEISPQYHSASCKDILLFIPLLATVVGLGGLGGSAADEGERKSCLQFQLQLSI